MATFFQPITVGNIPQRITGEGLFSKATFFGYNNFNISGIPVNNGGTIRLGLNSGELSLVLNTGSSIEWSTPTNKRESLNNFWLHGSTGAVYVTYY